MILVTLGTQDKGFERLLIEIDRLIEKKIIEEEVIVQAGYTKYTSKNMKVFDYLPKDEFEKIIDSAKYLITHGGVGSIFDGLNYQKKIIAIPRLSKYMEHTNDHQRQVVEKLGEEGYIVPCLEVEELEKNIKNLKNFHPKKYSGDNKKMITIIEEYIKKESKLKGNPKIEKYFKKSILLLICFYVLSYILKQNRMPEEFIFIVSFLLSYFLVIILECGVRHQLKKRIKMILHSLEMFIIFSILYLVSLNFLSFPWAILLSSSLFLILGYVLYMLTPLFTIDDISSV